MAKKVSSPAPAVEQESRDKPRTPDQVVEDKALGRMAGERLLDAEGIEAVRGKLSSGSLKAEDWRLAVESAIEREGKGK